MTAPPRDLLTAPLALRGRVLPASNATFLGTVCVGGVETQVVYKPVRGERPLWDFPDGSLASREAAAYAVSLALGWDVVPVTVLRDGPHGPGMVQIWQEPDPGQAPVDIVAPDAVPPGWRHVLDAVAEAGPGPPSAVSLVHEDTPALRRMAVFDIVVNNADRKGGHVLAMPDGHRYGVDHGVCFHVDHKLRTVLWGWAGEPVDGDVLAEVARVRDDDELAALLTRLLTPREVAAFRIRCSELVRRRAFPEPSAQWPAIPWPAF